MHMASMNVLSGFILIQIINPFSFVMCSLKGYDSQTQFSTWYARSEIWALLHIKQVFAHP